MFKFVVCVKLPESSRGLEAVPMAILEPLGRPRGRVEIPYRPPGGAMGSSVGFKRHQARFAQFDSPDFGCFEGLWTSLGGVSEAFWKWISGKADF